MVFSHYMEPYGVAAFLVSRLVGVPWMHTHAGSDLTTLGESPALSPLYDQLLRSCDMLLARPDLTDRFQEIGVPSTQLGKAPCLVPAPDLFSPEIRPIDWESLPEPAGAFPPPEDVPLVLVYGKLGGHKGELELIGACGQLRVPFHLLFVTSTTYHAWLLDHAARAGISAHVGCVGLVPHPWIGRVLRRAAIACQLEYDFPIGIHHSVVPLEIMASGSCLVVSEEIFSKQLLPFGARDGRHVRVVAPKNVAGLAGVLDELLVSPGRCAEIGREGRRLYCAAHKHSEFVKDYLDLVRRFVGLGGPKRSHATK
jgi:glycosyltransferase involved in cell wall biosynthesis